MVEGIDLMMTIFEAALIVGAGAAAGRPRLRVRRNGGDGKFSFETIAIGVGDPAAGAGRDVGRARRIPDLTQHSHGDGALVACGGWSFAWRQQRLDRTRNSWRWRKTAATSAFNPAAYWRETTIAGVDTLMGGESR